MKISNSPAALLAASAISLAGCKVDKEPAKTLKEPAKTLAGQLRELVKSNLEGVDGVKRMGSTVAFKVPDDRYPGIYSGISVYVDLKRGVIASSGGVGDYICEDEDGDSVWEKVIPTGCSRYRPPKDAYFNLKDRELRPVEWRKMQERCDKRAKLVLEHYRSAAK